MGTAALLGKIVDIKTTDGAELSAETKSAITEALKAGKTELEAEGVEYTLTKAAGKSYSISSMSEVALASVMNFDAHDAQYEALTQSFEFRKAAELAMHQGEKSFTAALPRDGERFGLELRLSSGDEVYELAGRGSQRDGDFVLRRDSESLARLSLQRSDEGLELAVVPREALLSALLPERLRSLAADLRLSLRTEGDTLRIELLEQLRTLLTLSFERSEGEETSLTAPAKALDFAQWRAALTPESFDGMFRNLKEAGLPAGLLMELRMQLEAGETASAP